VLLKTIEREKPNTAVVARGAGVKTTENKMNCPVDFTYPCHQQTTQQDVICNNFSAEFSVLEQF
jgi:hypothetical protein